MQCIFCKEEIRYGNNAEPLIEKNCCNLCNARIVVPARFAELRGVPLRIKLEHMDGKPQMQAGLEGTLDHVDESGRIHVNWDNGSTFAVNAETDIFSAF